MQTLTSKEYLQIDIANNFGLDKELWDTRLQWFADNEDTLLELVSEAEEPAKFYAGVKAYHKAIKGDAIGYPIGLDATASGAQLLAIMSGCEKSAALSNVVNTGARKDYYTENDKFMREALPDMIGNSRKSLKNAMVPWFYGSEKEPNTVYGENTAERQVFEQVLEQNSPGIYQLREALVTLWNPNTTAHSWVMPDNFHVRVKVKDEVAYPFMFMETQDDLLVKEVMPKEKGISNAANITHSVDGFVVREMVARCYYDADKIIFIKHCLSLTKQNRDGEVGSGHAMRLRTKKAKQVQTLVDRYNDTGFFSARFLDLIDEDTIFLVPREPLLALLESLPAKPFQLLVNHDCFYCLPNYGNDLRRQYNQCLYELAKSDILQDIINQLCGKNAPVLHKLGLDPELILNADYALS